MDHYSSAQFKSSPHFLSAKCKPSIWIKSQSNTGGKVSDSANGPRKTEIEFISRSSYCRLGDFQ